MNDTPLEFNSISLTEKLAFAANFLPEKLCMLDPANEAENPTPPPLAGTNTESEPGKAPVPESV